MTKEKIVIIGGVAGGATAAARLRRLSEETEIILLERGEYISFANCGLPYHISGRIPNRESLLLQTVSGMSKRLNIDIRNFSEVTAICREEKKVSVKNLQTGAVYEEAYDKLLISTGAKPIKPNISGLQEASNVHTLRNIPDMDKIIATTKEQAVEKATVIGGGFIGLEMVENLVELGIQVTLVEAANQVMAPLDFEMAQIIHEHLSLKGVKVILSKGVKAFQNEGNTIVLTTGEKLQTDMIILSIGVTPENTLAKAAGLTLGVRGTIAVNEHMQTSDPNIFAIGDVVQVKDFVTGDMTMIPLAWPANRQGRLVADYMNGLDVAYEGSLGTAVAKVFDLTVASTGNNEKQLKQKGLDYHVLHIHPNNHANYYPGATPIALKLLFHTSGKILGAQAVGIDGVEKRIDVIATAMKLGGTVQQLVDLELSYAPPYSSAKDPVNMAGYVATNMLSGLVSGLVDTFQWHEVDALLQSGATFIDVREPEEVTSGGFSGAMNIPLGQLRDRINEVPKDKTIYVTCQVGLRGYNAARILMNHGFQVKNLDGGYKTYRQSKYEVKEPMQMTKPNTTKQAQLSTTVDCTGLACPGPILKLKENMDLLEIGEVLEVQASDMGFLADVEAWCQTTGNTLLERKLEGKKVIAKVQKGEGGGELRETKEKDGATMVVFSGDLDKAIASFIIASGAAAMGKKVTLFFTFWGLNIIKKQGVKVEKSGMEKMFDVMLPSHGEKLPISKMNMGGLGAKMIKSIMKQKNVDALPDLMAKAQKLGVKFVACTMSMDVMGITREELMDNVELGGVAAYLGDAENAGLNLFI